MIYRLIDAHRDRDTIKEIVVRAPSEAEARRLAADWADENVSFDRRLADGEYDHGRFLRDPTQTTCELLDQGGPPGVLCVDIQES